MAQLLSNEGCRIFEVNHNLSSWQNGRDMQQVTAGLFTRLNPSSSEGEGLFFD